MAAASTTSPKPFSLMSIAMLDWKAKLNSDTAKKTKQAYTSVGVNSFRSPSARCLRPTRRSSNVPFGSLLAEITSTGTTPT